MAIGNSATPSPSILRAYGGGRRRHAHEYRPTGADFLEGNNREIYPSHLESVTFPRLRHFRFQRKHNMNPQLESVIEQARSLSSEDRIVVFEALQELIAPPDAEWETAWEIEVQQRIAAYERGEMKADDFDSIMNQLRREFLGQ